MSTKRRFRPLARYFLLKPAIAPGDGWAPPHMVTVPFAPRALGAGRGGGGPGRDGRSPRAGPPGGRPTPAAGPPHSRRHGRDTRVRTSPAVRPGVDRDGRRRHGRGRV